MSLMKSIIAAMVKPAPPKVGPITELSVVYAPRDPAPAPVDAAPRAPRPAGFRGSCKAINPATGRQCALLEGHTTTHRHGSTSFNFGAAPGQRIARRDELDAQATRSPFTQGETP